MPKITVTSKSTTEVDAAVTLEETIEPEHLESEHHADGCQRGEAGGIEAGVRRQRVNVKRQPAMLRDDVADGREVVYNLKHFVFLL